jgi:hypothetical protein
MGRLMFLKFHNSCSCFNLKKCRPSVLAKHKQLNNVLAAYFCKICIRLAASKMQISFGWSLAACKLGILYRMAASRMQFASGWRLTE